MANPASVSDLLAVLELGSASGDTDLADQLRDQFGIAPEADLASALGVVPPGAVLAALTAAVAPVAAMVRDLYSWLGQLTDVRSTANLSVRVTGAQMRTMDLDPARYKAYESTIIEEVSKIEFDPSRLPPRQPALAPPRRTLEARVPRRHGHNVAAMPELPSRGGRGVPGVGGPPAHSRCSHASPGGPAGEGFP